MRVNFFFSVIPNLILSQRRIMTKNQAKVMQPLNIYGFPLQSTMYRSFDRESGQLAMSGSASVNKVLF